MSNRPENKFERRNFVKKNMKRSGEGRHKTPAGFKGASRAAEKQALRYSLSKFDT